MNPFEEQAQQYLAEEHLLTGDLQQGIEDVRILGADIQLVAEEEEISSEAARQLLRQRVGRGNLRSYMQVVG